MREYTIVIEDAGSNYSAFVLDFDGCTSTGRSVREVMQNMREAIQGHLDLLAEAGDPIPEPLDVVGTATIRIAS